jgi:hypothetical protein
MIKYFSCDSLLYIKIRNFSEGKKGEGGVFPSRFGEDLIKHIF